VAPSERESLLEAVRSAVAAAGGVRITRQQFLASSRLKLSDLFRHFPKWSDALTAAGFSFDGYNERIDPEELLTDWVSLVRKLQRIPTRNEYKLEGNYSAGVFDRNFGSWSAVPDAFRAFAADQPEWSNIVALLPLPEVTPPVADGTPLPASQEVRSPLARQRKLTDRPTYGDPIDFRGLRHAPVNEAGVIFLFGMVARELGYLVESVQGGFKGGFKGASQIAKQSAKLLQVSGSACASSLSLKVATSEITVTRQRVAISLFAGHTTGLNAQGIWKSWS